MLERGNVGVFSLAHSMPTDILGWETHILSHLAMFATDETVIIFDFCILIFDLVIIPPVTKFGFLDANPKYYFFTGFS